MSFTVIANTETMPYMDWLEHRKAGIGGSDAAVVCGISRYKVPSWKVWCALSSPSAPASR